MRRAWPCVLAVAAAIAAGCAGDDSGGGNGGGGGGGGSENTAADDSVNERVEIAYLSFARKGDYPQPGTGGHAATTYLLLYTRGWMKEYTFGGPFEALVKREDVQTVWKEMKKNAFKDLYTFLYSKGFFNLPGSPSVDWTRFREAGYTTKVISVDRDGERHVVFLDDVTGKRGDDPRWDIFRECEQQIITTFSAIEHVHPVVNKDSFQKAFDVFRKKN
ncbi:MAG: hypothetical protein HYY18_09020 [Planctomycetes bacterium]|nr:hypothetical protein [Planctomycetota bacterium]